MTIAKHVSFINTQKAFHEKMAERFDDNKRRQDLHLETAEKFSTLAYDLSEIEKELTELRKRQPVTPNRDRHPLSLGDISDLPEELIGELSISGKDIEFKILNQIEANGGVISLDVLLIGLYRSTGTVYKRAVVTSRLYRMVQRSMVFSLPGKKGMYSTRQLSEKDVAELF